MSLLQKINDDLKTSLLAKDTTRLRVIRNLKTEITKESQLPKNSGKELADPELLDVIRRVEKRHLDSIDQFTKGNREDLVKTETEELEVVKGYLPKPADPETVLYYVALAMDQTKSSSKKDMGKVINKAFELSKGEITRKQISEVAAKTLN